MLKALSGARPGFQNIVAGKVDLALGPGLSCRMDGKAPTGMTLSRHPGMMFFPLSSRSSQGRGGVLREVPARLPR